MSPINKTFLKQDLEFRLLKDIMAASIELGFALKLSLIINFLKTKHFNLQFIINFYTFFLISIIEIYQC